MSARKFYGFYRGTVLKQLNNGYCLIEIPGILQFKPENIESLPPAEPAQGICGGPANGGTFSYPDIGSNVWCFFANGDIRQPVYFAISNVKSENWCSVSQKLNVDGTPTGFPDATYVHSAGTETIYGKTAISQINILKPNKPDSEVASSKIDMKVFRTTEDLERISKQYVPDDGYKLPEEKNNEIVNNGSDMKTAGEIEITNGRGGIVTITAGHLLRLHAPYIEIDTTNAGGVDNGRILFKAGNIEVRTTNGTVTVNNSNISLNIRNKKQLLLVGDKDVELKS